MHAQIIASTLGFWAASAHFFFTLGMTCAWSLGNHFLSRGNCYGTSLFTRFIPFPPWYYPYIVLIYPSILCQLSPFLPPICISLICYIESWWPHTHQQSFPPFCPDSIYISIHAPIYHFPILSLAQLPVDILISLVHDALQQHCADYSKNII